MDQEVRNITLKLYPPKKCPVQVGDVAKAHIKIKEGSKERVQAFEGTVLKIQGKDFTRSVTIRKISEGVGVEKTILLSSPNLTRLEVISRFKVRRARLYYLRKLKGRAARLSLRGASDQTAQKNSNKLAKPEETASKDSVVSETKATQETASPSATKDSKKEK